MNSKRLLYVAGPTASGKTSLAIALAQHFDTEIISCDSRQFYKEMSIGTAVPNSEELAAVKHHFIQQRSIHQPYSIGAFQREALDNLKTLFKTKDTVILVGGSGLYADALIDGLDHFPEVDPAFREQLNNQLEHDGIESLATRLKDIDPAYHQKVDLGNPHLLDLRSQSRKERVPATSFPKPAPIMAAVGFNISGIPLEISGVRSNISCVIIYKTQNP